MDDRTQREIAALDSAYMIGLQCLFNILMGEYSATTSLEEMAAAEGRFNAGLKLMRKTFANTTKFVSEPNNE